MSTALSVAASPPIAVPTTAPPALADCLTFGQIAEAYGINFKTVGHWTCRGSIGRDGVRRRLAKFKIGRTNYVRRSDLAAFLEGLNNPACE